MRCARTGVSSHSNQQLAKIGIGMKLTVVGIGPGAGIDLTGKARKALEECDVIVGYTAYAKLTEEEFPEKKTITSPMRKEVERCRMALEEASTGLDVAMICSGDPGVYGMASLCFELSEEFPDVPIDVIPGVTAATGGAALLGAPLTHDFAVISLSDLLTPWEEIEERLRAASRTGFAICLYNPKSHKRTEHLNRAVEIISESLPGDTVCGLAHSIGRAGEYAEICTLDHLPNMDVDMFTTVFIGNKNTKVINGRMVTPRGYMQRQD